MSAHARIGPSSLPRVIRCAGSVNATADLPRRSSIYAAEGSVLHEIAADCLGFWFEPGDFAGQDRSCDGFTFRIGYGTGETDPDCMIPALDWLREQPGQMWIEQRVSLEPYMPDQFGTLDVGMYDPETNWATIFDWKFGEGELVQVINNEQLQAYAVGFLTNILGPLGIFPEGVRIIIEQPRARGGSRFSDVWAITTAELMKFAVVMTEAYIAAQDPNAPRVAGQKQCRWCGLNPQLGGSGCDALEAFNLSLFSQKFDDIDENDAVMSTWSLPNLSQMTPERRSFVVRNRKMVEQWFAALHDQTLSDAIAGKPTPGLKAVAGQMGDRYWRVPTVAEEVDDIMGLLPADAEEVLVKALGPDGAFTKKLKSPAQAEKELKPTRNRVGNGEAWSTLSNFIGQDEGKPVLVDEFDPKPALKVVDDKFDEEDEADEFDLLK